jgi:hypothetical protein
MSNTVRQNEAKKIDFYVVRDLNTSNVLRVVFPNGIQSGIAGFVEQKDSVFYGKVGFGVSQPTALLHIGPGTPVSTTAPVKFTPGTLVTTPEAGAVEFNGTDIFYTTGSDRRNITAKPYASYYSNQNQFNTPGSESIFDFELTSYSSYINKVTNNKIYPSYSGVYNVAFSVQFTNADSAEQIARVWLKKDGANVDSTRSDITVIKAQGGVDGHAIMAANFFIQINVGSYIEMAWSATHADLSAEALPSASGPDRPASPSIVITVNKVS